MGPQSVEKLIRPLLERGCEPLDRNSEFDIMRMFYVALSRAKNLLIVGNPIGPGVSIHPHMQGVIGTHCSDHSEFDVSELPRPNASEDELPRAYSYTGDYLLYQKCARQYMIFRKYGFVASRSQTQLFGTLVHKTIEDLHHMLIARREGRN